MTHRVNPAISVEGVSKQFLLGRTQGAAMLREVLAEMVRAPFRGRGEREILWALRDLSFTVQPGEVVGIVGRNGAGKSTLLKILSRISRPSAGLVRVRGRVASLLEVGTGFHEELTGRENVYLSGCILGMPKRRIDAQLDAIVAYADVERFIDTPIKHYSSGMRLRLGFAVAAHLESDILLVDEVLAVGDGEFQRRCLKTMDDLHHSGRTVLFVSHNLAAVENLCSRALWIEKGRLQEDGPAGRVIQSYMGTFTGAEEEVHDLNDIPHRQGSGELRFTRIEFLSAKREPVAAIRSGDSVVVRLHFEASRPVVQPAFGVDIHTVLGTLAAEMYTHHDGYSVPLVPPGPGYIDLVIQDLNLAPGRYSLSLFASDHGESWHDWLQHCTSMDVQPSARYGLTAAGHKTPVMVLVRQWEVGPLHLANGHPASLDQISSI